MTEREAETRKDSKHSRPKRRSGKALAIGMLVLIFVGVAFALSMWFWGREPHGPIETVAVVDETRVAVLRQGFEERGYTHIGVWNADGTMTWSEALFGVQDDPQLSVTDELVLVLVTEARGNPALHAFALETGEFRWKVEQAIEGEPSAWGQALAVGDSVAWLMGPGREIRVVDLEDGEVRATVTPEQPDEVAYVAVVDDVLQLVAIGAPTTTVDARGELATTDYPAAQRATPTTREGDELCLGHPPDRCRTIAGLAGYAIGDDVVWIHSERELGVLKADDLSLISGPFEVGELTAR